MNDAYYEQLVVRKSRPLDMVIRFLTILVIVAVAVFGMPFLGIFSFFLAVVLAFLAYYFIFPRLDVEYEYVLLNHDMQVDAIYSKAKRKKMMTFDIQQAEIMAPKASPRLHSYQPQNIRLFFRTRGRSQLFHDADDRPEADMHRAGTG